MNKEEIQNIIDNLINGIFNVDWTKLLDYIKNIEQENQQLKKQKADVVKEIKRVLDIWENKPNEIATLDLEELLRMLGEIDE